MPSSERAFDRALRRGHRLLTSFGADIRDARLSSALSQQAIGRAVRMSHAKVSRIEAGLSHRLALVDAVLLAEAVGLDLSAKTYPGRSPTRDAGHARRMQSLLGHVGHPLDYRTEVVLPARDGVPERRAWDALIRDSDGRQASSWSSVCMTFSRRRDESCSNGATVAPSDYFLCSPTRGRTGGCWRSSRNTSRNCHA